MIIAHNRQHIHNQHLNTYTHIQIVCCSYARIRFNFIFITFLRVPNRKANRPLSKLMVSNVLLLLLLLLCECMILCTYDPWLYSPFLFFFTLRPFHYHSYTHTHSFFLTYSIACCLTHFHSTSYKFIQLGAC